MIDYYTQHPMWRVATWRPTDHPRIQNDQSALNNTTIQIACPAGSGNAVTVLWGDGTSTALVCDGVLKTLTHNYTATGQYEISVVGDVQEITDFRCYAQAFISGDLSNVIAGLGSNLDTLYLRTTGVTGDVAALAASTNLVTLNMYDTGVTGDVAALAACTNLAYLYLRTTGVTYTGPTALPAWPDAYIRLYSTGFTGGAGGMVDQFLIDFAATAGAGPGAGKPLQLDGTNGPRTAASDAAVTTLTGLGWVVQTN